MYGLVERIVTAKFGAMQSVVLNDDAKQNISQFLENYNDKYTKLKKIVWKSDRHIKTFTFTDDKTEQQLRSMNQYLARVKRTVMEPAFERLGPQVIEASRSASQLVGLMYQKRVKNEEFHQIVAGLARWHVLCFTCFFHVFTRDSFST